MMMILTMRTLTTPTELRGAKTYSEWKSKIKRFLSKRRWRKAKSLLYWTGSQWHNLESQRKNRKNKK